MSLSSLDYIVIVSYLGIMLSSGVFFYRGNSGTQDFFFAGRGINWVPLCISTIASDVSAIAYMGLPAFVFRRNLQFLPLILIFPLIVLPLLIRYFVPFYYGLNIATAYEYLERRFDVRVRLVASLLFLGLRAVYMGIVIYAPSLMLSVVSDLAVWRSVVIIGLFTTLYTALGGMRAVIWTDVIQFCMVIVGLTAIISAAYLGIGAEWSNIWSSAHALGHTRMFDFSFALTREFSFWAILIGGIFPILNGHATDQVMVQRYMSARSAEESQKALRLQAILYIPLSLVLQAVGLLLVVFYHVHPAEALGIRDPDTVVPYFALHTLRSGLAGLVIASIFAASMSAMSGGINALTNATVEDFYRRLLKPNAEGRELVRSARLISIAWGVITTVIALLVGRIGSIAYSYDKVNSLIGGVILGLFLLGMLTRKISGSAALAGAGVATLLLIVVAYGSPLAWLWYGLVGCATTFAAAWVGSMFSPRLISANARASSPLMDSKSERAESSSL
jgi:SSS family transporter